MDKDRINVDVTHEEDEASQDDDDSPRWVTAPMPADWPDDVKWLAAKQSEWEADNEVHLALNALEIAVIKARRDKRAVPTSRILKTLRAALRTPAETALRDASQASFPETVRTVDETVHVPGPLRIHEENQADYRSGTPLADAARAKASETTQRMEVLDDISRSMLDLGDRFDPENERMTGRQKQIAIANIAYDLHRLADLMKGRIS